MPDEDQSGSPKLPEPTRKAVFRYMVGFFIPSAFVIALASALLGFGVRLATTQTQMEALRAADSEYQKKLFEVFEDATKRVMDRSYDHAEKMTETRIQAAEAASTARATAVAARVAAEEAGDVSKRARILLESNVKTIAEELIGTGVLQRAAIEHLVPELSRRIDKVEAQFAAIPIMHVQTGTVQLGDGSSISRSHTQDVKFPVRFKTPPQVMVSLGGLHQGLGPPGQPTVFVELVGTPSGEGFKLHVHQKGGDLPHLYLVRVSWIAIGDRVN